MSTLQTRIMFGVIMFALFFGILALDSVYSTDIGFGCLAILAGGIGLYEFYHIAGKNNFSPFRISGIVAGVWLSVSYWLSVRTNSGIGSHFLRHETMVILIFWLLLIQTFTRGTRDAIKKYCGNSIRYLLRNLSPEFRHRLASFPSRSLYRNSGFTRFQVWRHWRLFIRQKIWKTQAVKGYQSE